MDFPNPTIPNEIITEILLNLGKNDLLKCRLVSQSWNELSLKILRNPKYGHEHELTQDNIDKVLEFIKQRNDEWVLPFHLNFKLDEYEETLEYHLIPKYIQQLQRVFGETCVGGLTLTHDDDSSLEAVEELISILTLIAPSLTRLDLSEFNVTYRGEEEKMKVEELLEKTQLNFPNLAKLKSCPAPDLVEANHSVQNEKNNKIHTLLIEKSQNLKDLEVLSPYGILPIEQIGNLRKLKIVDELITLVSLLEQIRICPNPVLKDISLFCSFILTVLDHQMLYDFLASFSTSLQSLTIEFQEVPTNAFPRLSQLKYLSIQVTHSRPTRARRHVVPEELNLTSDAFPVLESMDISANVYLESTEAESGSAKDNWNLRTVKNLRIKVMVSSFNANAWDMDRVYHCQDPDNPDPPGQYEGAIISRPSVKDYVNQLQKIFPNVTSLTLVNEIDGDQDKEEYLNELLTAFIQSDGAPKIKELEVQNCKNNYLGHILNGLNPDREPRVIIENVRLDKEFLQSIKKALQGFSGGSDFRVDKQMETRDGVENSVITCKAPIMHLKMTGIEKIRMNLFKELNYNHKSRRWARKQESNENQKDLFLINLPKHLPLLRQIDISQRMFGDDKEFCKQQIVSVQNKFPDLVINTLH